MSLPCTNQDVSTRNIIYISTSYSRKISVRDPKLNYKYHLSVEMVLILVMVLVLVIALVLVLVLVIISSKTAVADMPKVNAAALWFPLFTAK